MADFGDFTAAEKNIDPNVALSAKPPPPIGFAAASGNPFDMAYRLASTQNALNANTQFQLRLMAQKALGPIYAQNIDPNTGELNTEGVLAAASRDPRIAPMLPSITTDLLSQRHQILQNQSQKIANELQKTNFGLGAITSVLDSGKDLSDENLQRALEAGGNSPLSVAEQAKWLTSLPLNPQERREALQQLKVQMLTAQERLTAAHKDMPQIMTGSNIYQFQQDQLKPGSPLTLVAQGRMGLTPEQQIAQHQIAQPGGGYLTTTGADLAAGRVPGQNPGTAGTGGGVTFGGQVAGPQPQPSANLPAGTTGADLLRGSASPAGAGNPLAARPPGAPTVGTMSITPGAQSYQEGVNKGAVAYKDSLDSRVAVGGTIMQTLQEARDSLSKFNPGGGAEEWAKLAQAAQAFGAPQALVDAIGNKNLAASQEFQKLMVNTTMGQIREQLQGVGASRLSQMEFATFQQNNPNIDTDPRAIEKIFNFWTRLYQKDKAEQSQRAEYIKNGGDPVDWPAKWQDLAQQQGYINPQITNKTERTVVRSGLDKKTNRRVQQYSNGDIEYVK